MEIFLIRLLQFILAISLLVLLHEGGHMVASKLFGVKVEKFFIFFDLGIGKWSGKLFSFKPKGSDTEYGMGWLPLGGYCKIAGMIDESFDTEQMKKPAQPWEFRSKPKWQQLIIMVAGVTVNFVLALFIYAMVLFAWGEDFVEPANYTYGMRFNSEAKALGFRDHDRLIATDRGPIKSFGGDMYRDLSEARTVEVLRGSRKITIHLPGDLNLLSMVKNTPRFVEPFMPMVIDSVMKGSPAEKAGIRKGTRILALNGKPIDSYNAYNDEVGRLSDRMSEAVTPADSMKIRKATLVIAQPNGTTDTVSTVLTAELQMGMYNHNVLRDYRNTHVSYGFLESFPAGVKYGWKVLRGYVDDMKYLFTRDGAKSLGGFGAIGSLFPPTWDWHVFWLMTAFLSIILAFMNILPIPALDGGHVFFLLCEIIIGRDLSENFKLKAEYVGMGLLILLMVVANLNDVLRWIGVM